MQFWLTSSVGLWWYSFFVQTGILICQANAMRLIHAKIETSWYTVNALDLRKFSVVRYLCSLILVHYNCVFCLNRSIHFVSTNIVIAHGHIVCYVVWMIIVSLQLTTFYVSQKSIFLLSTCVQFTRSNATNLFFIDKLTKVAQSLSHRHFRFDEHATSTVLNKHASKSTQSMGIEHPFSAMLMLGCDVQSVTKIQQFVLHSPGYVLCRTL